MCIHIWHKRVIWFCKLVLKNGIFFHECLHEIDKQKNEKGNIYVLVSKIMSSLFDMILQGCD